MFLYKRQPHDRRRFGVSRGAVAQLFTLSPSVSVGLLSPSTLRRVESFLRAPVLFFAGKTMLFVFGKTLAHDVRIVLQMAAKRFAQGHAGRQLRFDAPNAFLQALGHFLPREIALVFLVLFVRDKRRRKNADDDDQGAAYDDLGNALGHDRISFRAKTIPKKN
ncbi:MAG: hypothetical protein ING19_19965 [Azospirillum sp.]|nr:hypothetical protein [Azospirillum sp.]